MCMHNTAYINLMLRVAVKFLIEIGQMLIHFHKEYPFSEKKMGL